MLALVIEWRLVPLAYLLIGLLFARSYVKFTIAKERMTEAQQYGFMFACGGMVLLWPIVVFLFIVASLGAIAIKSVGKVSE